MTDTGCRVCMCFSLLICICMAHILEWLLSDQKSENLDDVVCCIYLQLVLKLQANSWTLIRFLLREHSDRGLHTFAFSAPKEY